MIVVLLNVLTPSPIIFITIINTATQSLEPQQHVYDYCLQVIYKRIIVKAQVMAIKGLTYFHLWLLSKCFCEPDNHF